MLDGTRGYLSTDGCPGDMIDLETRRRRGGTKADLAELTRLADALPEISFMWQCVSANDTPVPCGRSTRRTRSSCRPRKHIQQMTAVDGTNAAGIVEMARAIAGDADRLRARPLLSNFQCVISPLHWDHGPVDAMRMFAEAGIPVGICSMPLAAASSPVTLAGTLAVCHAEILSGLAILQSMVPGSTAFYVGLPDDARHPVGRDEPGVVLRGVADGDGLGRAGPTPRLRDVVDDDGDGREVARLADRRADDDDRAREHAVARPTC